MTMKLQGLCRTCGYTAPVVRDGAGYRFEPHTDRSVRGDGPVPCANTYATLADIRAWAGIVRHHHTEAAEVEPVLRAQAQRRLARQIADSEAREADARRRLNEFDALIATLD